ncbi:hypothetical protein QE368_001216 [Asaia bogorensis NBRC 16594]|nr:hypothetical protein [Asaia bogorensis NBRC 16594]
MRGENEAMIVSAIMSNITGKRRHSLYETA